MLASFFAWWLARVTELLPNTWTVNRTRPRDGVVVDVDGIDLVTSFRSGRQQDAISLGAAARLVPRHKVMLRPLAGSELVKQHIVPTAPRRQLDQLLRYELGRITPFRAEELFWQWEGRPRTGDPNRTDILLTMVPKTTLASALASLDEAGLHADFIEVGRPGQLRLLPVGDPARRSAGTLVVRGLIGVCAGLAIVALLLPLVLQAIDLHTTETAIDDLKPAIKQVEALRRGLTAGDAGRDILNRESQQTGDVLQTLAAVTRILPDDTYLTDFSLRQRQMTLSGRSASAPRLITGLSADPAIQGTAFAAPVTRIEAAALDVFSIKAEVAR